MFIVTPLKQAIVLKYRRWNRKLTLSKRGEFVLATVLLTFILLLTQLISPDYRYAMVFVFMVVTYGITAFVLRENLSGIEWLSLLTLPSLFSAAVALYYFLLPMRWLTRIPIAVLFAVGMYALLLTENIYNIAANRTIALVRAAHSVGFLLTLITYYFLIQTVLAFGLPPYGNIPFVFILSFLLSIQILWSVLLEQKMPLMVWYMSLGLSVALTQISWIITFLPVGSTMSTLFLTTCFYSTIGILQQYLLQKYYKKTFYEYAAVVVIVLIVVFMTAKFR